MIIKGLLRKQQKEKFWDSEITLGLPSLRLNVILLGEKVFQGHSLNAAAAAAKSLQSCPILCDPIDGSPPGSPVPGILQARTLEWVAIPFSNA